MTTTPFSRYPVPDLASLPDDIRTQIETVAEKTGFVPNVFATLAHRPDEFRAFFSYYEAVMNNESALSKAEREMIVVATSAINQCLYCVISHGALLRIFSKEPLIADQIAVNYRKAPISARQKAMLDFACKVAADSASICEADFEALARHGFSDEDAWDIGAIAAFFGLSNRMANLTGMLPNAGFYAMARG
ncbi:peroxidase-related enzyme [Granulosicoccaceae sp. 1_MG-2023]|nr:peroxidase-related enzyme [Granulosicoccaceae sp. 1_MG-2023]